MTARPVTRGELEGPSAPLTIAIYSESEASLAGVLGCSRGRAYALVRDGTMPVIRIGPYRLRTPVARLLELLGEQPLPIAGQKDDGEPAGHGAEDGQVHEEVHERGSLRAVSGHRRSP